MVASSVALVPVGGERIAVPQRSSEWDLRILRVVNSRGDIVSLPTRGCPHAVKNKGGVDRTSRLVPTNKANSTLVPPDPKREVALENMRLSQRISSLQRWEKSLEKDNLTLTQYMSSLRQEDETCQRTWEKKVQEMESACEGQIKELEKVAVQQKHRLREMPGFRSMSARASPPPRPMHPDLTNAKINSWFRTRGNIWYEWADDYAHRDLDRIINLDMIQQNELCRRAATFVRLTDEGDLPSELLVNRRINPSQILLHGLLANFIATEIIASPRWIFAALNVNRAEFVSPDSSPISPISRNDQSFGLSLKSTPLSLAEGFPSMRDVEKLDDLFAKAQMIHGEVHKWRSQLMRILTDGGLSHDHLQRATSKNMRRLVRARREYAKTLRERFLSGPARFLLRDQDAAGIERLEWKLINELDMALRLSAQIWSYQTCDLSIRGIDEFGRRHFDAGEEVMDLCQAQQMELSIRGGDKRSVIAVLRPEIRAMGVGDGDSCLSQHHHYHGDGDGDGFGGIWAKAQVFVSPRSVVAAEAEGERGRLRTR